MRSLLRPHWYVVIALASWLGNAARAADNEVIEVSDPPADVGSEARSDLNIELVYESLRTGGRLYKERRYREALPDLLVDARRGFKFAQACVGFIYQQGPDGVPRNPEAAVGWLGVAARGPTHPEIRNYFDNLWQRIPEAYHPSFTEIIDTFEERYGTGRTVFPATSTASPALG